MERPIRRLRLTPLRLQPTTVQSSSGRNQWIDGFAFGRDWDGESVGGYLTYIRGPAVPIVPSSHGGAIQVPDLPISASIGAMNEMTPLTLQLLEWISDRPRSYAETMDAWRSSCPSLTIWEDALASGLVQIETRGNGAADLMVSLTAVGKSAFKMRGVNRKNMES